MWSFLGVLMFGSLSDFMLESFTGLFPLPFDCVPFLSDKNRRKQIFVPILGDHGCFARAPVLWGVPLSGALCDEDGAEPDVGHRPAQERNL